MKIIRQKFIPLNGFLAINIFGNIFCKPNAVIDKFVYNHESIHTEQMKEMLYIPFYIWYFMEWLIRLLFKGNAYRNISFEREAYDNQNDLNYINKRKHYSWLKMLFK